MSDEQRLHDALTRLVPDPLPAPDRADGARAYAHRARRRRTAAASAAVLTGIVVVVALISVSGFNDDESPQPVAVSPGVVAGEFDCPPPRDGTPLTGPDQLPQGPIAARLCFNGGTPWQAPRDALTSDLDALDALVTNINEVPVEPLGKGTFCLDAGGWPWALLFQYPDGHTQLIRGNGSCGGISVGSVRRGHDQEASIALSTFQDLLAQQRARSVPPGPGQAKPSCDHTTQMLNLEGPGATWMRSTPPQDITGAALCWRREAEPMTGVALSPTDLATVFGDFNAHATRDREPPSTCLGPELQIVIDAVNVWGDELMFFSSCGTYFQIGDPDLHWEPSPDSQAIIDRLISGD